MLNDDVNLIIDHEVHAEHPVNTQCVCLLFNSCTSKPFIMEQSMVHFSLVPLTVTSFYHLRDFFFVVVVTTGLFIRDLNLHVDFCMVCL